MPAFPPAISSKSREIERTRWEVPVSKFLLNDDSIALSDAGRSAYPMTHELRENYRHMESGDLLNTMGYLESWFKAEYRAAALRIGPLIRNGHRSGRASGYRQQDIEIFSHT